MLLVATSFLVPIPETDAAEILLGPFFLDHGLGLSLPGEVALVDHVAAVSPQFRGRPQRGTCRNSRRPPCGEPPSPRAPSDPPARGVFIPKFDT